MRCLQAVSEMAAITKIVQSQLEAPITHTSSDLLAALGASPSQQQKSAGFLSARQQSSLAGFPAATNIRVMASDEPFPTIASMVEDLVCVSIAFKKVTQRSVSIFFPAQERTRCLQAVSCTRLHVWLRR